MAQKTALIICDVQKDIINIFAEKESAGRMIAGIKRLIEWARKSDVPIIYSNIGFRPDYLDALPYMRDSLKQYNVLRAGTEGGSVVDELAPQDGDILICRQRVSSFYNSNLDLILRSLGVDTLLVTGCSTARVVESTIRDAHDRNLHSIVVSDACSASTPELHENALKSIGDFFGKVMTVDEAIAELS